MTAMAKPNHDLLTIERQSLCLSGTQPGVAIHAGEAEFKPNLERHFRQSENNTAERLVEFKAELRKLDTEAFWGRLMEGLADICHAQFAFASKRILVDDHDAAVEMPPIGEMGSCLMGVALYWNDGRGTKNLSRDYKYFAWSAPCSYMRHDKVFLVPYGLSDFITENPNQLPFECDAYLGLPLFADGKCFAHFGLMWTKEGLSRKKDLSWGYLEMLLHSLEDMVTDRLVSSQGFAKPNPKKRLTENPESESRVIPVGSVTTAQSLKPYARSLSHELRTPMQGVVGMLDVMYATVQEQIESMSSPVIRSVFQSLKESIETVQDSSKRAVEAADNVVHAYDLNMQIPDTPSHELELPANISNYFESRPKMLEGSNILNPHKRRRSSPNAWSFGNPTKIRNIEKSETPRSPLARNELARPMSPPHQTPRGTPDELVLPRGSMLTPNELDLASTPTLRQSNIRDLIPIIINDSLRVGGRPDSAISEPTQFGERIEVRTRSSNGHASQKTIDWSVDPDVPDFVAMDERDLTKLISQVFLNANKYTECGTITIHARVSTNKRYVTISVADTGTGIPEDFQPELFKPFAKEDHSLTRSKEGLGLGLLVAKGVARRVGGDITLVRSSTEEPDRGTEFEIHVPLDHHNLPSRAGTPLRMTPDHAVNSKNETQNTEAITSAPRDRTSPPPTPASPSIGRRYATPRSTPQPTMSPTPHVPYLPTLSKLINAAGQIATDNQKPPVNPAVESLARPTPRRNISTPITKKEITYDRELAKKYPLTFLVAEDNKINRKLLVNMLNKFGYRDVYEAFDGKEAVRVMENLLKDPSKTTGAQCVGKGVDVVLMDLWMPEMDGYEATERILAMFNQTTPKHQVKVEHVQPPIVLAVSADVTEAAVDRATRTGMQGYMTKPYMLTDLQRLIVEFCGNPTVSQ